METLHRNGSDLPTVTIRLPKRLRFSLRGLLVVTALVAIGTYGLVVRPTAIANKFVTAIGISDYVTARSLMVDHEILNTRPQSNATVDRIYADLLPPEWGDVWGCRRRLILQFAWHEDKKGGHVEWTTNYEFVADSFGLKKETSSIASTRRAFRRPQFARMPSRHALRRNSGQRKILPSSSRLLTLDF